MKKWFLGFLGLIVGALFFHLTYLYLDSDFTMRDFQHASLLTQRECKGISQKEVFQAISQPFFYCGRGQQMTAFESQDHQYVIKFFNPRKFVEKKWFSDVRRLRRLCSLKWISTAYFKKAQRINDLMDRYQMGFDELKSETALVYVHLNPATTLNHKIHLTDRSGKEHVVSLESIPFVIQRKGVLALSCINQLIQEGKMDEVRERISQLQALFSSRIQKGFTDLLQTLHNNYVFIETRAVQIDLGTLRKDPSLDPEKEMQRILAGMVDRNPQLTSLLSNK